MLTVARIPNLEYEAFYFDMERRGFVFRDMQLSTVPAALDSGDVDAGPVSLLDSIRLAPQATLVSGFCVASVAGSWGCALHTNRPIDELAGGRIALGDSDATSAGLLRLLLRTRFSVDGTSFVDQETDHDALLVTGNPALRQRRRARGYSHRYDLGEEWQAWTALPFVFSRWMARAALERPHLAMLEDALFVGQEDWMNNLYKATRPRDDLLMAQRDILEYVQGLRFFIGVPEDRAIALFRERLAELG